MSNLKENQMSVVITKQPIIMKANLYKIFFFPNGKKSEMYNMTDQEVMNDFNGPGLYSISSVVNPKTKSWVMTEMKRIGDIPKGYQVEDFSDMDTFCFDLLNLQENEKGCIEMKYCSSFDPNMKSYTLKLCDEMVDEIYSLGFKLKINNKYKVSRQTNSNGKKQWLFATLTKQDEDIDKRKKQWEQGTYKDRTTEDNLNEMFGFDF